MRDTVDVVTGPRAVRGFNWIPIFVIGMTSAVEAASGHPLSPSSGLSPCSQAGDARVIKLCAYWLVTVTPLPLPRELRQ